MERPSPKRVSSEPLAIDPETGRYIFPPITEADIERAREQYRTFLTSVLPDYSPEKIEEVLDREMSKEDKVQMLIERHWMDEEIARRHPDLDFLRWYASRPNVEQSSRELSSSPTDADGSYAP